MPAFRSAKPSFRVKQTVAQNVAPGGQFLTFDTVVFEEPAGLWTGPDTWTVDRPGLYLIGVQAGRSSVATSSTIIVRVVINAATQQSFQSITTTNGIVAQVIVPLHLEAGDTVKGNVTFHPTASVNSIAAQTHMWGIRVGPKKWT